MGRQALVFSAPNSTAAYDAQQKGGGSNNGRMDEASIKTAEETNEQTQQTQHEPGFAERLVANWGFDSAM